ncbi:hypothetical protein B0H13DRAFT_1927784 [Mycena leptocephala]|nr:hypothetical protein B0H13DRAFT_1927784 [Mycena leptocephala]
MGFRSSHLTTNRPGGLRDTGNIYGSRLRTTGACRVLSGGVSRIFVCSLFGTDSCARFPIFATLCADGDLQSEVHDHSGIWNMVVQFESHNRPSENLKAQNLKTVGTIHLLWILVEASGTSSSHQLQMRAEAISEVKKDGDANGEGKAELHYMKQFEMERIFRAPIASQQQWPPQYQPRATQPMPAIHSRAPPPLGVLPPPELFEEPDPPLPPPDPPAPAALAPTAEMGMAVPVNEVANSPASITQAAPPLPSNEQQYGSSGDTDQGISGGGGGVDGLGMVIPEGREKLGIETLGTAGNDVAAGRMRVTAALAPWNAGGRRWVALKKRACT